MSNLVDHAKRELSRTEEDQEFIDSIVTAIERFASYGHSGSSALAAIEILGRLLRFENLTPLTDDPAEWIEVSDDPLWQSKRNPEAFSVDKGRTFYTLSSNSNRPTMRVMVSPDEKKETGL